MFPSLGSDSDSEYCIANPSPLSLPSLFVIVRFGPFVGPALLYNNPSWSSLLLPTTPTMARSPLHHASLVDPALHSPALLELLDIKLSRPVFGTCSLSSTTPPSSPLFQNMSSTLSSIQSTMQWVAPPHPVAAALFRAALNMPHLPPLSPMSSPAQRSPFPPSSCPSST